jgi:hypothetical protein
LWPSAADLGASQVRRTPRIGRPRLALLILIALIGCGIGVIVAVASGAANPRLLWLELIVLGWSAMCVNALRPENDPALVAEFAKQLAGDEPLKLHCRAYGGYGIDSVLVATDQRLIYGQPGREGASREVYWTVPYAELTSFVTQGISESADVGLRLRAGIHEYAAAPISKDDAKRVSEIVAQNRPQTAEPIVIRLNDNAFKKARRTVHRSGEQEGNSSSD